MLPKFNGPRPVYTTKVHSHHCPYCKTEIAHLAGQNAPAAPIPGSVAICGYCTGIYRLGVDLEPLKMAQHEVSALPPATRKALAAARQLIVNATGVNRNG